ncbi:MAG TPA: UTP--glucose-1-phosphate uridylyltransferase [Casimicrobiaceae bacterium]|nr:UTP--glucose-1-phosphate uridylyltransferase [Casimicrobiaceae bacterium]
MKDETNRSNAFAPASRKRVMHVVFPVAGFGTAFLPATKACPKEMLPIVDRPLIQYAVEEAAAAGLTRFILVTGRNKRAIEDHFDRAYELEHELAARESDAALRELRSAVPSGVTFSYVRQREASGLPDALRSARSLIGQAPFAVILPDDLIDAPRPALAQLLDVYDEQQVSVAGVQRSARAAGDDGRLIAADLNTSTLRGARELVKVPPIGAASGPVSLCGRYVFTSAVWDALKDERDPMLAATLRALMERERVFACVVEGKRFDCGTKLGFLEAQFAFAQKHRELWPGLRRSLGHLLADKPAPGETPAVATSASAMKSAILR